MMKLYYSIMLWCAEFERELARLGGNHALVAMHSMDADKWRKRLLLETINGK